MVVTIQPGQLQHDFCGYVQDLMELFSSTFQRRTSAPARLQSLSLTGLMSTCGDRPQVVAALLEHRPAILAELTSVCRDGPSDEERLCAVKLLLYGQCHDGWRQQLRDSSGNPLLPPAIFFLAVSSHPCSISSCAASLFSLNPVHTS